jgi:hypothetical protein
MARQDARTSPNKAFEEGKAAAEHGGEFRSPYRWGTAANRQWCAGYMAAP